MYKILIIEDDQGIAEGIQTRCQSWGFEVQCVKNFKDVLHTFVSFHPHLVLLDITLPFYDGFYWCSEIRKISKTPIIFISSATERMNMLMAMNMGGDDFVCKPFDIDVLLAKIHALLRRTYDFSNENTVLEFHGALIDTDKQVVMYQAQQIALSKNEYLILICLVKNKGKVVSREKLMNALWQTDSFVDENTLSVNVNRLRKKLENAGMDHVIETKFKVGYMIV
jgi:two-component system response regulator protein BraR/BceR